MRFLPLPQSFLLCPRFLLHIPAALISRFAQRPRVLCFVLLATNDNPSRKFIYIQFTLSHHIIIIIIINNYNYNNNNNYYYYNYNYNNNNNNNNNNNTTDGMLVVKVHPVCGQLRGRGRSLLPHIRVSGLQPPPRAGRGCHIQGVCLLSTAGSAWRGTGKMLPGL